MGHVIDPKDREQLADAVTRAAPAIGREAPKRLTKLRQDLELVTLNALIEQFQRDLDGPYATNEAHWQMFFNNNRFALQLIFATPMVVFLQHATVQAAGVDGRGARITDFLCLNPVTRTAVIVEIKTPRSLLMTGGSYRGSKGTDLEVYPPHQNLVGPVAQLQSQMASVPRSLASRLDADSNIDAWHDVRGAVITGRISALSVSQRESFLRYRAGLTAVTVLGYDEVLDRLRSLRDMLASTPDSENDSPATASSAGWAPE